MKRKKINWEHEVALLRQKQERDNLYRQMLEGKIRDRNERIAELTVENEELKKNIDFKSDYIHYLEGVIAKDVEKMSRYVSFFEKVLELTENIEDDLDGIEVSNAVNLGKLDEEDAEIWKRYRSRFGSPEESNCEHFRVISISKEDLEDLSFGDFINEIIEQVSSEIVGDEDE